MRLSMAANSGIGVFFGSTSFPFGGLQATITVSKTTAIQIQVKYICFFIPSSIKRSCKITQKPLNSIKNFPLSKDGQRDSKPQIKSKLHWIQSNNNPNSIWEIHYSSFQPPRECLSSIAQSLVYSLCSMFPSHSTAWCRSLQHNELLHESYLA